jgi:ABC-type multidrug transport system fused ATPase/permease subunit
MEPTLHKFILRNARVEQLFILFMTLVSYPFTYATLELPKIIVNQAIGGRSKFPRTELGVSFDQIQFLMALCVAFLVLVLISGGLKYYLNVYRGRLGERMARRLRYLLYARILRFPLPQFKKMSQGEIIPMITSEVEPVGGFIGDALGTPAYQGGTLIVYIVFIFIQDPLLGLAAVALYPVQMVIIPRMQKKINALSKLRIRNTRSLADRIGETISGITEIHAHDTSRLERADVVRRLDYGYEIRYEIFRRKFFVKFLNNFIAQLTPFFFYSIGGYFVIKGELSFGALVAVLAAYKDLNGPWKELLNWYQLNWDIKVKYEQVVEQFEPPGILDEALQDTEPEKIEPLKGEMLLNNLSITEDGRMKMIDGVSTSFKLDDHVAVTGSGASGKDELTLAMARLLMPSSGSIRIGGHPGDQLPEAVTGRRIGYVSPQPYMFASTVRRNLCYGLMHKPVRPAHYEGAALVEYERYVNEARHSGNLEDDPNADWIDYEGIGIADQAAFEARLLAVLEIVDMADDIYKMGLLGTVEPAEQPELAESILKARAALRERLKDPEYANLVETFDPTRYSENATMAENLLFGTPVGDAFDMDNLARSPYVIHVLEKAGLIDDLVAMGRHVAETMIELFAGLPPGHEFFAQYAFISSDDLPEYQTLLTRTAKQAPAEMRPEDRERLLSLPFRLSPARHRLGVIDDALRQRILEARKLFAEELPDELRDTVEFFHADRYNAAATIQDNVLFGKIAYGQAQAVARASKLITEVLADLKIQPLIMEAGLGFNVGVAGSRLAAAQRQKLGLARAILKQPDLLIVNDGISALDGASQLRVLQSIVKEFEGRGVVWAVHRTTLCRNFNRILVMRSGRIVEQGSFAELSREGTVLHDLLKTE